MLRPVLPLVGRRLETIIMIPAVFETSVIHYYVGPMVSIFATLVGTRYVNSDGSNMWDTRWKYVDSSKQSQWFQYLGHLIEIITATPAIPIFGTILPILVTHGNSYVNSSGPNALGTC